MLRAMPSSLDTEALPRKDVVLVVEDEILVRSHMSEVLRDAGFNVIEAGDSAEAITVLASTAAVDIVFSDINMPGAMDGLELAAWLAVQRPGLPVLLTSGVARIIGRNVDAPDRGFISKPFNDGDIAKRLRRLLVTPSGAENRR